MFYGSFGFTTQKDTTTPLETPLLPNDTAAQTRDIVRSPGDSSLRGPRPEDTVARVSPLSLVPSRNIPYQAPAGESTQMMQAQSDSTHTPAAQANPSTHQSPRLHYPTKIKNEMAFNSKRFGTDGIAFTKPIESSELYQMAMHSKIPVGTFLAELAKTDLTSFVDVEKNESSNIDQDQLRLVFKGVSDNMGVKLFGRNQSNQLSALLYCFISNHPEEMNDQSIALTTLLNACSIAVRDGVKHQNVNLQTQLESMIKPVKVALNEENALAWLVGMDNRSQILDTALQRQIAAFG